MLDRCEGYCPDGRCARRARARSTRLVIGANGMLRTGLEILRMAGWLKILKFGVRVSVIGAVCGLAVAARSASSDSPPTATEYAAHVGGAQIVPYGELVLDGTRMHCGRRPTVLDPSLDDYGAAYPGFLILNPRLIARVPTAVKLWIYSHECGHQFRGQDEETADCFAVQRGRRQRWLTSEGLDQICQFINPAKASSMHYSGPKRCELMRACYVSQKVR